jgi:hypothetical protein
VCLRGARVGPNVTSIEKKGRRQQVPNGVGRRRRRHRGEAAEDEKGDATPDLLLKHSDVTLAIYV